MQVRREARAGQDPHEGITGIAGQDHYNQPANGEQRFSLHQRWAKTFPVKTCAGHVLLVEVTQTLFEVHHTAAFAIRGKCKRQVRVYVGKGGKVLH